MKALLRQTLPEINAVKDIKFGEMIDCLNAITSVQLEVDWPAVKRSGLRLGPGTRFSTRKYTNITYEAFLSRLLTAVAGPNVLTYTVKNGKVVIVPADRARDKGASARGH